ncbi:MAG: putative sensor domain DACNV-containing protein [Armatimonadaceae bacterium]
MATRVYPRNLFTELQRRWTAPPLDRFPRIDLPEKRVFDELVDVCYHTSFTMEEGRPIVFRVAIIGADRSVSPDREEPLPFEPIERYLLGQAVPFTENELRRLAPVADPRRVIIAVEPTGEGSQLRIYGLIDVGMALWEMARHEGAMGVASPEVLVVSSTRPGELLLARGDRPVLRLRGGKIEVPADRLLFRGPVARFFAGASDDLIREACRRAEVSRRGRDDGREFAHIEFIESILLHTAELNHGGALLFVPEDTADDDEHLAAAVSIKYRLPSNRPRESLLQAMAVRLQHNATHSRLHRQSTVRRADMEELEALDWNQGNYEDTARDAARFIASLTAVDGAVVLTDQLRIIGFGAEVRVSTGTDTIYSATDAQGTDLSPVPFTSYGTRHRSSFRFVESMEPAVAFILSQDGGIKAAIMVDDRVVMWPYFEVGYTTALS